MQLSGYRTVFLVPPRKTQSAALKSKVACGTAPVMVEDVSMLHRVIRNVFFVADL